MAYLTIILRTRTEYQMIDRQQESRIQQAQSNNNDEMLQYLLSLPQPLVISVLNW